MSDKRPAISVLIPVYNVERYLRRCLDSILGQSFGDFDVVCVNDASPDGSPAILREYAARDSRIKIINKPENEGLMRARYSAYTVATGRYFFFCDSDDFLPDDALETLYTAAEASGADITVGNMLMVNPSGKQILRTRAQRCGTTSESYLRSILHWNSPTVWGSLFRRELFAEPYTALHKQGFSEDRILMTELLLRHNAKVCPVTKPTYYYWLNNTSITRSKLTEKDVRSQFAALFRCYDLVDSIAPGLRADNNNYMARYLSLYIEKGVSASLLRSIDERVPRMLRFAEMKQWTGARLAAHTALCIHLPGYRATMHGIRSIIRKLQGKD